MPFGKLLRRDRRRVLVRIIDITRVLQEAPVYPGDIRAEINERTDFGGAARCSVINAGSHSGTHADAFSHFIKDGLTIDQMPLENYCGPCLVLTVPKNSLIQQEDLQGKLGGAERIILHTGGNSFLSEDAANYLVNCRIKAVVTDAVSIGPNDNEAAIHISLMRSGIAIIENAVLDQVEDGKYFLFAFPVKYGDCDGAPVRAVLLRGDE